MMTINHRRTGTLREKGAEIATGWVLAGRFHYHRHRHHHHHHHHHQQGAHFIGSKEAAFEAGRTDGRVSSGAEVEMMECCLGMAAAVRSR